MKKTKILFLDHTPFAGGAQYVLAAHIKCLSKDKFDPVVVCSQDTPEFLNIYKASGAKVITIKFGKLKVKGVRTLSNLWASFQEVLSICKSERPNLVVTNTVRAHIVGTLVALRLKIPLIWIIRDYTFNKPLFKLLKTFPKKIFFVSQDLVKFYGLKNSNKEEIIYVGSDFDQELKKVKPEDLIKLKEQLELKKDFVVGYVGRLVGWKGAQVLVKAMEKVIKNCPYVKAVIVGGGAGQEDNNEKEIKDLVNTLKLHGNVILCGSRPVSEMSLYYKTFTIFVHPSIEKEPFATVIINAMMIPLPVIGTNLGGTPEIIKHGENGLLVSPNNPDELAEAILGLLEDPVLRDKLSNNAYLSVYPSLTESKVTEKMEKVYQLCQK